MLKDISIGQYFPGKSIIHRLDPRVKIILTIIFMVLLFSVKTTINPLFIAISFFIILIFLLTIILTAKLPIKIVLRSVKPIIPLVVFTAVINMFFISGTVIFKWWIISITQEGVVLAIIMTARIILLIISTSLSGFATSPVALTDAIERLLKPLNLIKFPVHEMAMMMTIALRFIPTLIEETDKIMSAQKARGADLETGGIIKRAKALIPILIPLFVSAFRRADELALAMECRCYRGGKGRTRMKQLHIGTIDILSISLMAIVLAVVILLNYYIPTIF